MKTFSIFLDLNIRELRIFFNLLNRLVKTLLTECQWRRVSPAAG